MKKDNLIWWIVGGISAYALYKYYTKKKNDIVTAEVAVADVLKEEEAKFSDPLRAEYQIIMPADQVSKKVKAKGEQLRRGRYALQPQRIKQPVTL